MVSRFAQKLPGWMQSPHRGGHLLSLLLLALSLAAPAVGAGVKFEATLDRNVISLGESVTLSMNFEGGSPGSQPPLPSMQNIQPGSTGMSQNMFIDGTQMSVKTTFTIELHPIREGDYTIPSIRANVDGALVASQPIKLKVVRGNLPSANGAPPVGFVKIILPKNEIYLGEVIPVEIQCYCQSAIQASTPQISSDGFTVGAMPEHQQQPPRVSISNSVYFLLTYRVPVTAVKTGALMFGPAEWHFVTGTPVRTFFGTEYSNQHEVVVNSDPLEVRVLPI